MASNTNDNYGLFWNSQGGDRKYDADSFGRWASKFMTTGVFTGDCEVTPKTNAMAVYVAPGFINIINENALDKNAKILILDEQKELVLDMADSLNPRIDTVVIERNDNERMMTVKIVTGTPAATPTPTAPIRTDTLYQLVLAQVYVAAGATSITSDKITMKRDDPTVCGIITGTVFNDQITYGTTDLIPGVSELADGTFYFVFE